MTGHRTRQLESFGRVRSGLPASYASRSQLAFREEWKLQWEHRQACADQPFMWQLAEGASVDH